MSHALRPYLAAILAPLVAFLLFWLLGKLMVIPDPLTLIWLAVFLMLVGVLHIFLAAAIKPPSTP